MILDIHTHNIESDSTTAILDSPYYIPERIISLGIHPWDIDDDWEKRFHSIEKSVTSNNVVAIGECGIDRIKSPASIELQKKVFRTLAELAERTHKPLIIHSVKAIDEIIAIHKELVPEQPWIIHGFRGKPQQAIQLAKAGLYISLGEHFNPESARAIPINRLFIESDESRMPIGEVYAAVAAARGTDTGNLERQIESNAHIFGAILQYK